MLTQFYPPIIGGEERIVQDLSVELARRGHEVAVATLWHEGFQDYELDQGVSIFRIHSTTHRASWLYSETQRRHAPPWPDPEATWALRQGLAQVQPEIVHAHNWFMYSFLPLKWQSHARLVISLHDYSLSCAKRRLVYQGAPCSGPGLIKCLACSKEHYGLGKGIPTALGHRLMSRVGRGMVDMFLPVSTAVASGNGLIGSSCGTLKRTLAKIERRGWTYNVDPEPEFFLFKRNGVESMHPVPHDVGGYFDFSASDDAMRVPTELMDALITMGLEVEMGHHEVALGQHEIDFRFADALRTPIMF